MINVYTLVDTYQYLLLILVTLFTYQLCKRYRTTGFNQSLVDSRKAESIAFMLCILFSFLIGLRPIDVWTVNQWGDTAVYMDTYRVLNGTSFQFEWQAGNKIWDNLFSFWACNDLEPSFLFFIAASIYFGATYVACKKWFPHDTAIAYLAFLGAFSTYSYSYNGVKAGVAGALFLVAIAYYEKKSVSILFALLSLGFHHSMQLPIATYILTIFFKESKWYFYGWIFCVLMATLHIGFFQSLFMGFGGNEDNLYLQGVQDDITQIGFRPDFMLYSAAPIWIGYRLVMKENRKVSKLYLTLLHIYLCTNGVWMLCMYAAYSNRIAYLSWFMYPFVLIYPFLKEDIKGFRLFGLNNQYRMLAKVAMYHLYFTLFMNLVYYKILH